jgi:branched-chain amino acid transport system substrate-binding protein
MKLRTHAIAAVMIAVACFSQGCEDRPRSPGMVHSVKIGAIYPLTGADPSTGQDLRSGIELALEIINTDSGLPLPLAAQAGLPKLGNATVEVIFKDSRNNPKLAADLVEELVTQH